MRRIVLLPGKVDDACDLLALAQEHGVAAAHLPLLARVELDEIGAVRFGLADDHRDREHGVGHRQDRGRALRGLPSARTKPARSAPASAAAATSSSRVSPQTFTSGRDRSSASFAAGIRSAHERRADEDRVRARELGRRSLRTRLDAALRDDDAVARRTGDELELLGAVDLEGREIARVDPDHRRVEGDGTLELVGVVRLDERLEAERRRGVQEAPSGGVVEVAQEEQRRVGARLARGAQIVPRSRRSPSRAAAARAAARAARRSSHVPPKRSSTRIETAAAPARSYAAASAAGSASGRRSPGGRRASLHLRDRGQSRRAQCVGEASHHADCRENATSSSRRTAARPLSMASARERRALREGRPHARAAAIAPAALSTTASRLGAVGAGEDLACGLRVLLGRAARELGRIARGDAELDRVEHPLADGAFDDLEHEVRPCRRELVDPVRAVDDESAPRVEDGERVGDGPRHLRRVDAEHSARARRPGSSAARGR